MATRRGRTQAYAAGNKVYGGGRPMPTIGPVDKTGYRERDAKGMIWKNALSRRLGSPGGIGGSNNLGASTMPGTPQEQGVPTGISDSIRRPINTRTATGQPSTQAQGGPQGSNVVIPQVRPLTASPSGSISGQASQGMNGLPYDPSYEGVRRAISAKRDAANAGIAQQKTNMDLEANGAKREIDQQAPEILKQLLEGFAGRGLAYSGKYATDRGEQENQFAAAKSRIDQQLATNRSALEAEMAKFEAGLASELSDAEYQYARSLAENAGNLGIVQDEAPVAEEQAPIIESSPEPSFTEIPQQQPSFGAGGFQPVINPAPTTMPQVAQIANGYQSPAPPQQQAAPMDLASRPGGVRTMASFDPRSQATLSQGGTIVGGNGYTYKYDPNTQQAVRVR